MPEPQDQGPPREPRPRGGRAEADAWEAVVRQELLRARRRRPARFAAGADVERVVPALRGVTGPDRPPRVLPG